MEDLNAADLGKVGTRVRSGLAQREGVASGRVGAADDGFSGQGELGLGGHVEGIIARTADEGVGASGLIEDIAARSAEDRREGGGAVEADGRGG